MIALYLEGLIAIAVSLWALIPPEYPLHYPLGIGDIAGAGLDVLPRHRRAVRLRRRQRMGPQPFQNEAGGLIAIVMPAHTGIQCAATPDKRRQRGVSDGPLASGHQKA